MSILGILKTGLIVYISLLVFLYFFQRSLIYFPDKTRPLLVEGGEIASVTTADGLNLEGWYFPPKNKDALVIVYFHGNGGNLSHRYFKIRAYLRLGYGVLLTEYRGYGGNPGYPNEKGFYADGRAYMDWLLKEKNPSGVVLYGESIGSGTATQMATEYKTKGLVLEAPFSSMLAVASQRYFFVPVKLMLKDRYMNIDKISKINAPLLILHGNKDNVIPVEFSQELFDRAAEPKEFIDFPEGRHNDLHTFAIADFVIKFLAGLKESKE